MRLRRMPSIKEGGVNVTPLIDIVMCLIIFFMLVAKIGVAMGFDPNIDIPVSQLGKDLESYSGTLVLNVTALPGAMQPTVMAFVEGSTNEYKILDEATAPPRRPLVEMLKRLRNGPDMKPGTGDDNTEFKVIIRAPQDLEYRFLEPVLMGCAEARVKNVNFNTKVKTVAQ